MASAVNTRQMILTQASPSRIGPCDSRFAVVSRTGLTYVLFVMLPLASVLWILRVGAKLDHPFAVAATPSGSSFPASTVVLRPAIFLIQIIVIIAISRLLGASLRKLGQPRVIGEMLAGLMLGPSMLGLLAPNIYGWLFPFGTVRFLSALAQTGLVLFMFIVGMELDLSELLSRRREALVISHASIMVPMAAGTALALPLYRNFAIAGIEFRTFALFLGCAMSITALPVLARILRESNLSRSAFGSTALGCAAVADLTAWIVFGVTIAIARDDAANVSTPLWPSLLALVGYLAVMLALARPLLRRICGAQRETNRAEQSLSCDQLGAVLLVMLTSAAATELLKIHAIFGAFVAGAMMPRSKHVRESISNRLDDLLSVLLLPLFFAYAGLRTNIGELRTPGDWMICAAIIGVAVVSKVTSCVVAGGACGMPLRTATGLGLLMNTRGLMELVLLTIGLQLGIITPLLFTMMVVMAIFTTAITAPLFSWVMRQRNEQSITRAASTRNNTDYAAAASLNI